MSINDAILSARLRRPYYARAIAALRPVVANGLGTVAVDKYWRLYYDPEWLDSLSIDHQGSVIACHEIEHLLRRHCARCATIAADPHVYNAAGDMEINDDCADELPPNALLPSAINAPDGLTAEEYYGLLVDRSSRSDPSCGGGSGAGRPLDIEQPPDGECVSDEDADVIRRQVAADVRSYVAQHGRGSVSAGVIVWADSYAAPIVVNWKIRLASVLSGVRRFVRGRDDWSWAKLPRRSRGVLSPGQVRCDPTIGIVADTSGSMGGGEGSIVLGVVRDLARRYGQATVVQCDAAVTSVSRRPRSYRGGGGTDLRPAIELAARSCHAIVVVTDGDTPWPTDAPSVPVTVVLTKESDTVPKWAEKILV